MGINKEEIKKDFEKKPIIDYIFDFFKNNDDKNDNAFSFVTVRGVQNLFKNNDLDARSKKELKKKLSMFTYFMGLQQNFILDPYLLFGLDSNIKDKQDADQQIKDRYNNYLYKLQELYKENGNMLNSRANVMSSITKKINYAYAIIKDENARKKYNNLVEPKMKNENNGMINPESIKIKIKEKNLMFMKVEDSIIAKIGEVHFEEYVTRVKRSINVYALKKLEDSEPRILYGNLDLSLLDYLNYDDEDTIFKNSAEKVKELQLSETALKNATNSHKGYVGEISYVDGEPRILYDDVDQELVNRVARTVKLKLENYAAENDLKGGERKKSEGHQPEER